MKDNYYYINKKDYYKSILLLDNKNDNQEYSMNSTNNINNSKDYKKMEMRKKKKKNKSNKKFKLLRNFSTNFEKGLFMESPHKSVFAKRILSEIIPENLSKKKYNKNNRKKFYETDYSFLILNTPKTNNSFFSNKFFSKNVRTNKKKDSSIINKRYSHFINAKFMSNFGYKRANSSQINYSESLFKKTQIKENDFFDDDKYKDSSIQNIIEEDDNKMNSEDNDNTNQNIKSNSNTKIKLNLKKIPFIKPKKLVFNNILNKSENTNFFKSINKKKKKSNTLTPKKINSKKNNLKKNFFHEKFISNFLTPINQFMKNEFSLTKKEYESINKKIHDYNYLINNNEYSLYINKIKKGKYKEFSPPKIENIKLKKFYNKKIREITQLKNYKFKI